MGLTKYGRSVLSIGIVIGCTQGIPKLISGMASAYVAGSSSVAYVTAPSEDVAKKIAQNLVQQKMAACVNIIPKVLSIYEWEGKVNEDMEVLMMIKTRSSHIPDVVELIKKDHPYDCPEVISIPIENGSQEYLKWIEISVPVTNKSKTKEYCARWDVI